MALPRRIFYALNEVAIRWDCPLADIAGWASAGHFDIVAGIQRVLCASGPVAGYVSISVADIQPMFRRHGAVPTTGHIHHIRPPGVSEWSFVADPEEGIEVTLADLMIRGEDVQRFEDKHELLRRPAANNGATPRYDWDDAFLAEILRVHEQGFPATQAEWIGRMQEWFALNSKSGEVPDERTIRRRLTPAWKSLRISA